MTLVAEWTEVAEIKLNTDKTEVISIGMKHLEKITIGEDRIETKSALKYLRVVIDRKQTWKDHLDYLAAKADKLLLRLVPMCWT